MIHFWFLLISQGLHGIDFGGAAGGEPGSEQGDAGHNEQGYAKDSRWHGRDGE